MIIKSMSRKTRTFRRLLEYIANPAEKGPLWTHNLPADPANREEIEKELLANARLLRRRRNGNVLYHEILSFSSADQGRVSVDVMEAVTRFYLELRAPYALACAQAHFNTDCPHVHLVISANDLGSANRLRLSKARFQDIKLELNAFVRSRFPELAQSSELIPVSPRLNESRREIERRRRGEPRSSQKLEVRDQVSSILVMATSGEDLFRRLMEKGLKLYKRGASIGIEDTSTPTNRRYRLRTLGLEERFHQALQDMKRPVARRDRDHPSTDRSRDHDVSR